MFGDIETKEAGYIERDRTLKVSEVELKLPSYPQRGSEVMIFLRVWRALPHRYYKLYETKVCVAVGIVECRLQFYI